MRLTRRRLVSTLAALAVATAALLALAGMVGGVRLDPAALLGGDDGARTILLQLRLPRVLLAALAGAATPALLATARAAATAS